MTVINTLWCLLNSVFLHAVVEPSVSVYTAAVDYADRAQLFGTVAMLTDCSSLVAVWGLVLCLAVVARRHRGLCGVRKIIVAGSVHSVVAGLTVVVLVITAVALAFNSLTVFRSKVRWYQLTLAFSS